MLSWIPPGTSSPLFCDIPRYASCSIYFQGHFASFQLSAKSAMTPETLPCSGRSLIHQILQAVSHSTHVLFLSTTGARQVAVPIQSLARFPSDGPVGDFSLCFSLSKDSNRKITAKLCRLSSSFSSSSTSAVRSHIRPALRYGHHERFMSSHIVTRLVFSGPSHEPHSKLTCPSNSGTDHSLLQNYSQLQLFRRYRPRFPHSLHPIIEDFRLLKVELRVPRFFGDEWIIGYSRNA